MQAMEVVEETEALVAPAVEGKMAASARQTSAHSSDVMLAEVAMVEKVVAEAVVA